MRTRPIQVISSDLRFNPCHYDAHTLFHICRSRKSLESRLISFRGPFPTIIVNDVDGNVPPSNESLGSQQNWEYA